MNNDQLKGSVTNAFHSTKMTALLERIFLLKKGERGKVLLSVSLLFLTTANLVAIRSARDAMILARSDIDSLPLLYVVSAVFLTVISWLYSLAAKRFGRRLVLYLFFLLTAASLLPLYFLAETKQNWFPVFFYVYGEIIVILASVQGWSFISEQLDARQGKRLFGLIGAGGILSGACGGFGIQFFTKVFPIEALLLFAALVLFLAFWATYGLARLSRNTGSETKTKKSEAAKTEGMLALIFSNKYILTITAIFVLTGLGTSFCDYIFKVGVRQQFGGSGAEMASFFGFFYGVSNSVMLLYSLFFSGRVLAKLGVRGAGMALPLEILAGCVFAFFSPGLLAVSVLKFGDSGIRYTLHNSALNLAAMPFSPSRRAHIKTFMGGIVRPIASGLAGVVLMALAAYGGPENLRPYLAFLALTGMVWVAVTTYLKKGYLQALYDSLEGRRIDLADLSTELADDLTISVLEKELDSPDKYRVLYALEFLEEICPEKLLPRYADLLKKWDDPDILAGLLPRIERLGDPQFYQALEEKARLLPALEGLFVKAMAASDSDRAREYISGMVSERKDCVDFLSATIRYMTDDLASEARVRCRQLAASQDEEERLKAARIITASGALELEDVLDTLLDDETPGIRTLAIEAIVAHHPEPFPIERYWEAMLDQFSGKAAARALKKVPGAPLCLQKQYAPDLPYEKRLAIIGALHVFCVPESIGLLLEIMRAEDVVFRRNCAGALSRIRKIHPGADFSREKIFKIILQEISEVLLLKILTEQGNKVSETVCGLLKKETAVRMEIIFRCLGLVFKQEEVYKSYLNITEGKKTTNAIEFLDSMAEWPGKNEMIVLFEGDIAAVKESFIKLTGRRPNILPVELVALSDRVLQCLGLHLAEKQLSQAVELVNSDHGEVAEAAVLHLHHFTGESFTDSPYVEFIRNKEAGMLSTIERIIFLRGVDVFGTLSGEYLLHLAKLAHEEEFAKGAVIVTEDTLVDRNLYVIIEGEVMIDKGGREIAVLHGKECFGEMALLDNKPRSASARAKTDCRCLTIGHDELKDLIAVNSNIALGIIEVLSERIRTMLADSLY